MLNLNNEFCSFNKNIKLSNKRKEKILASRNAVREKIRNYFKEEIGENMPVFHTQGSFTINTALNPLNDDEVDIDDGV